MNTTRFYLAIFGFTVLAGFQTAVADESEIRQFIRQYADAFNEQDLEAVAGMWAEDAVHIDQQTGEQTDGREAITADIAIVFDNPLKTHITGEVESVRLVSPAVATVRGTITTAIPDEDPETSQYTAVLVNQDNTWRLDSVEETAVVPPAFASDALQQLDWLVGDWLDESNGSRIVSSVRWSESNAFLVRTMSEQAGDEVTRAGTQIIGWDPRANQIRSWNFAADGSFGDGVWTNSGDEWFVKSSQTLASGEASSGTYVITPIDDNTISVALIGHEVEGEPIPASEPVSIVRLPETDKSDEPQPQPAN